MHGGATGWQCDRPVGSHSPAWIKQNEWMNEKFACCVYKIDKYILYYSVQSIDYYYNCRGASSKLSKRWTNRWPVATVNHMEAH